MIAYALFLSGVIQVIVEGEKRSGGGSWGVLQSQCNLPWSCDALEQGADSIWSSGSGAGLAPGSVAT